MEEKLEKLYEEYDKKCARYESLDRKNAPAKVRANAYLEMIKARRTLMNARKKGFRTADINIRVTNI